MPKERTAVVGHDEPKADDIVTVTRIDRLARSTFDLFGIVKRIVDVKAQVGPVSGKGAAPCAFRGP
jgi:hypothetical protein